MSSIELISAIVAALGNIIIGLFTLLKNPKSATGKLFFAFTSVIALYIVGNYIATHQTTDAGAAFWVKLVMSNAVIINFLFYLLVDTFPQMKLRTRSLILWLSVLLCIILIPITFIFVFESVVMVSGSVTAVPGIAMPVFLLHTLVYLGGGFLWLVYRYRKSYGIEKTQRRFFIAGAVFMFASLLLTNLVLVVVFNNSAFVGLLPLYSLVFVGCIGYAMVRHRLLDINVFVVRLVVYTILIFLVSFGVSGSISLLGRTFLQLQLSLSEQLALIVITVVISLLFQRVKLYVDRLTDKIFFKERYVTNEVLSALSHVMASTLRLEDVAHGLLQILLHDLKISKGAIVLIREGVVVDVLSEGYKPFPTVNDYDVSKLLSTRDTMNGDEMEESEIKNILATMDVSVAVHLRTEGEQIGLLALGAKSSGDIYSVQDIELLEILAPEAGVAIQNALAYEEIRRFNTTLEVEVAHATDDLRQANEKLTELDKLKDEFVSLASHELRTPLTSIRSYLWMALSGKGGSVTDKQKYYLDRAFLSADRLIRLVNDMLNISRIESGRLAVQFSRSDVPRMIRDVIAEVQPKIDEQGLTLRIREPEHPLPDIIADTDKMKEVLINFIGNAIKFTPRGGVITVSSQLVDEFVRVSVTDTGLGFEEGESEKLFKKFSTLNSRGHVQSAQYQSTGLGLYISKGIVSLHGGTVEAHSDGAQRGAIFSFTLPVYTSQKREELQRKYMTDGLGIIHSSLEVEKSV